MKFELFVGWRYLRKRRKNYFLSAVTIIAVGGVAVSVMTVMVVLAVMNGFGRELEEKITGHISPVIVERYGGLFDYRDAAGRTEKVEGVLGASPFIMRQGLMRHRLGSAAVMFMGIDPSAHDRATGLGGKIVSGSVELGPAADTGAGGVLVGRLLADKAGLAAGSYVQCIGAGGAADGEKFEPSVMEFKVSGIFETGMYEYDNSLVYMSLDSAKELFRTGDIVDGIEVTVADIYLADRIAEKIEEALGAGYVAVSWMVRHRNLFNALALEKKTMFIILSLIVIVAAFNIMSTLVMLVMEKTRDIGILKALGAGKGRIMKIFIINGVIIGLAGILLGSAAGFLLCHLLDRYPLIQLPGDIYLIDRLPVSMSFYDFALVNALAFLMSVAAAIYPAAKASKLNPVEALRYE